jgi:hypothetical protein
MNWAEKGINTITDIWDEVEEDWQSARDIYRITKSIFTNTHRTQVLDSIPKSPNDASPRGVYYL